MENVCKCTFKDFSEEPETDVFWKDCDLPHLGAKLAKKEAFDATLPVEAE